MIISRAPVRISFGGGGTDLAAYYDTFGGFVVSAAITRYCRVRAELSSDRAIRISSADYHTAESFTPGTLPPVREPLVLPKAALEWFARRGLMRDGVELHLSADVPPGSGLGSSSAMAAALVHALAGICHMPMNAKLAAELVCALEIDRLSMPIGKQDQYASAYGGLNTIEFSSNGVRVRPLNVSRELAAALSDRLLLFSTGKCRDSSSILRQQRADSARNRRVIEALHQIKSLAIEMRDALITGELDCFGRLLDRSWQQKRRLSPRISSTAIDHWYAAARDAGALGGKIAGAGGGGFLLLYCPLHCQPTVRAAMAGFGLSELLFDFDFAGAQALQIGRAEPTPAQTCADEPLMIELGR